MNALLWILQMLLGAAFAAHGLMMLMPPPAIAAQMDAVLSRWFQRFLGTAEVLAAIGITVPGLTRIQPWLVAWAAWGLAFVMISALAAAALHGQHSSDASK